MSDKKIKKGVPLIESVESLERMVAQMQKTLATVKTTLQAKNQQPATPKPKTKK